MELYDISQEVFSCCVFPGDPAPEKQTLSSIAQGDPYNLTSFSMCAHNGTHVDAPFHFLRDGKTVDQLSLSKTVGYAFVADHEGEVTAEDAVRMLRRASALYSEAAKRILIKGNSTVTLDAAKVFADAGVDLIGNESQTVGPEDSPLSVHKVLLGADAVLLEGIRLSQVPEGVYLLSATPLPC